MLNKHQQPTKAICNKGFRGYSSILPRSNFGLCRQESSTQSLTAHSLDRWATYKKPTAQTAHLVFSDTKANAEKTKRAVFCQRSTERHKKVNFIPNKLISLRKTKTS